MTHDVFTHIRFAHTFTYTGWTDIIIKCILTCSPICTTCTSHYWPSHVHKFQNNILVSEIIVDNPCGHVRSLKYSSILCLSKMIQFIVWTRRNGDILDFTHNAIRGVARVMNMCTHNARGTDLQSFSETGREWIFPNSWLLFYGGNPHTRCAKPSGHGGGYGGKIWKKDRKWWHLMVFSVKILIYKFWVFFIFFVKFQNWIQQQN